MVNEERLVRDIFVFGGSAGGLEALLHVLCALTPDLPATIGVVIHRSPTAESQLAAVLGRRIMLPVSEPNDGDRLEKGHVYLAPRARHMMILDDHWRLERGPKMHMMRPAVDPLLMSAAAAYGHRVVGIVLSGGGDDGVDGLIAIKSRGGLSIAQRPDEARQPSMPLKAIREDDVDAVLEASEIATLLPLLAFGKPYETPGARV